MMQRTVKFKKGDKATFVALHKLFDLLPLDLRDGGILAERGHGALFATDCIITVTVSPPHGAPDSKTAKLVAKAKAAQKLAELGKQLESVQRKLRAATDPAKMKKLVEEEQQIIEAMKKVK